MSSAALAAPRRVRAPSRRGATLIVLVAAAATALALFHVWVRLRVVELGYQLAAESRTSRELQEENRALRIEIEWLKSPARIQRLAGELDLAAPDPTRIRTARLAASGADAAGGTP